MGGEIYCMKVKNKEFKYLGAQINDQNEMYLEIRARIAAEKSLLLRATKVVVILLKTEKDLTSIHPLSSSSDYSQILSNADVCFVNMVTASTYLFGTSAQIPATAGNSMQSTSRRGWKHINVLYWYHMMLNDAAMLIISMSTQYKPSSRTS
ncbi:hypothetical protein CEXT_464211 [Caerostris extrusa]|uniref:Uncharacterized protein n=1 Tax=Caerostris extrusa TaxID=172846 RepID=A0AAV4WVC5_CAEEX|nr:hypothetical protein CEXT_464211 [Caerostris extrusa]